MQIHNSYLHITSYSHHFWRIHWSPNGPGLDRNWEYMNCTSRQCCAVFQVDPTSSNLSGSLPISCGFVLELCSTCGEWVLPRQGFCCVKLETFKSLIIYDASLKIKRKHSARVGKCPQILPDSGVSVGIKAYQSRKEPNIPGYKNIRFK